VAAPTRDADQYDLVHVRAHRWTDGLPRTASLLQLDFEFEGRSLSLDAARARRHAVDRHGITGLIVPARYRTAGIRLEDAARRAAEAARAEGVDPGPTTPLLHADHPMYFTFRVPSVEGTGSVAGSASGAVSGLVVSVDKCDGHIWSDAEMSAYFGLIGPR
jgi:hypothetical protein